MRNGRTTTTIFLFVKNFYFTPQIFKPIFFISQLLHLLIHFPLLRLDLIFFGFHDFSLLLNFLKNPRFLISETLQLPLHLLELLLQHFPLFLSFQFELFLFLLKFSNLIRETILGVVSLLLGGRPLVLDPSGLLFQLSQLAALLLLVHLAVVGQLLEFDGLLVDLVQLVVVGLPGLLLLRQLPVLGLQLADLAGDDFLPLLLLHQLEVEVFSLLPLLG